MIVILDEHEENGPPQDYTFNLGDEVTEEENNELENRSTSVRYLFYLAAFGACLGMVLTARRFSNE